MLRPLYHNDFTHLILNSLSLYGLSSMEDVIGKSKFIQAVLFIWIVSRLLLYLLHKIAPSANTYAVGFSGVVFGLIIVYLFTLNENNQTELMYLVLSVAPQLFIPGISYVGHLCGIIAGLIYVYVFLRQ